MPNSSDSSPLDPTGLKQLTRRKIIAKPAKMEANTMEVLDRKRGYVWSTVLNSNARREAMLGY